MRMLCWVSLLWSQELLSAEIWLFSLSAHISPGCRPLFTSPCGDGAYHMKHWSQPADSAVAIHLMLLASQGSYHKGS